MRMGGAVYQGTACSRAVRGQLMVAALEVAERVLWRAPEGRGFSPAAKRAATRSAICGQGVGAAGLKPRPSEALNSVFPQPLLAAQADKGLKPRPSEALNSVFPQPLLAAQADKGLKPRVIFPSVWVKPCPDTVRRRLKRSV